MSIRTTKTTFEELIDVYELDEFQTVFLVSIKNKDSNRTTYFVDIDEIVGDDYKSIDHQDFGTDLNSAKEYFAKVVSENESSN